MGLWLAIAQLPVYADDVANAPPPPDLSSSEMAVDINTAAPDTAVEGYVAAEAAPAYDVAPEAVAPVETAVVAEEAVVASAPAAPAGDNVDTEQVGRVKVQTITNRDRYGTIQEERVNAMRSELHYIPDGSSEGYALVSSQNSQGKTRNAHDRGGDSVIPSWKLFAW
jgi:hypothetical protein